MKFGISSDQFWFHEGPENLLLRRRISQYSARVRITLGYIATSGAADCYEKEIADYVKKTRGLADLNLASFRSEISLIKWVGEQKNRFPLISVLLDSRGRELSSESLAGWIGKRRDEGAQHILFAIGPPDGWSDQTRTLAKSPGMLLSLGPMTLPHPLARLVLAEQLFRSWAILTGHPYHRGH